MAEKKTSAVKADEVVVSPPIKAEHGAQVRLTGDARAAARGGLAGTLADNIIAKRALEADGTVADGMSPDGTSVTGRRQVDDVLAAEQDTPSGKPEETRVVVSDADRADAVQAPAGVQGTPLTPTPDGERPGATRTTAAKTK